MAAQSAETASLASTSSTASGTRERGRRARGEVRRGQPKPRGWTEEEVSILMRMYAERNVNQPVSEGTRRIAALELSRPNIGVFGVLTPKPVGTDVVAVVVPEAGEGVAMVEEEEGPAVLGVLGLPYECVDHEASYGIILKVTKKAH